MSAPLQDQIAVVTGACGRLGPMWAEALLEAGARVAALDVPGARETDAFGALAARAGERMRRIDCDITSRGSIEAAAQIVRARLGEPSVLVNNAGVDQPPDTGGARSLIENLPLEQFRRMVDVNLLGTFQVTQVFGGRMAELGRGSIVNI